MKRQQNHSFQASLSPREKEVATLLANGKSRNEIAEVLSIKAVTVRAYLESARDKLNARNVIHAATLALARGLIVMTDDGYLINESSRTENAKDCGNLVLERKRSRKNKTTNQKKEKRMGKAT